MNFIDFLIKLPRALDIQQMKKKYFGTKYISEIMSTNPTVVVEPTEQSFWWRTIKINTMKNFLNL